MKIIVDIDHIREVTVTNGTDSAIDNNDVMKSIDSKGTTSNNNLEKFKIHTNGCINNACIATKDEQIEKMQEPPTADPEDIGERPFHGHTPSI